MSRDLNLDALVYGMKALKTAGGRKNALEVMYAMSRLRKTNFPEAYLDGLQDELLALACEQVPKDYIYHVYLTFHGESGVATYMKVGMSKNVKSRVESFATGNPLPALWTYAVSFVGRHMAYRIESVLHSHLNDDRVKGEWFRVPMVDADSARDLADELAKVASPHTTQPVIFNLVEA